jgi:hypothetical protein
MKNIIVSPEQVTPAWLTDVLRKKGTLPRGQVTGVIPDPGQSTFASTVWRLAVGYSSDALPGAPEKLFLKVSHPLLAPGTFDPRQLQQEITFYQLVAPEMGEKIIIPCYAAAYEPATGTGHILLPAALAAMLAEAG